MRKPGEYSHTCWTTVLEQTHGLLPFSESNGSWIGYLYQYNHKLSTYHIAALHRFKISHLIVPINTQSWWSGPILEETILYRSTAMCHYGQQYRYILSGSTVANIGITFIFSFDREKLLPALSCPIVAYHVDERILTSRNVSARSQAS